MYPWSIHGIVTAEFPNGILTRGTATLIDNDTAITAAHCLYFLDRSGPRHKFIPATRVSFSSGIVNGMSTWQANSLRYYVHPEYINNDEAYDFGVIKLDKPVGSETGWASLVDANDAELESKVVTVAGYPAYKGILSTLLKRQVNKMYSMSGPITISTKHKIYYKIDTSGGQSGAGVWILNDSNVIECCGIHVTGSKIEGNGGIRINAENFDIITDWLQKFKLPHDQ
ncbi:MAG: trypsin-like serine protease [Alphaproteobacteria bacterium]|nr:trypsin-like serine protease [Alphaproteobacteria bacterium]